MKLSKAVLDIRTNWAISDAKRDEGLTTPSDIKRLDDISYGPYGKENLLDIYMLKNVSDVQPTIVNIHGGGWVYGCKEIYQFYCMSLAERGFTVVNINYRLAPETRFPGAVEDINQALTFISEHSKEYFIDSNNLFLIGDSAGGQLVSHYATVYSNKEFASMFDFIVPNITIKAVGLNCGAYDTREMAKPGMDNLFLDYLGFTDKPEIPEDILNRVDALSYMNKDFPPAYIMSAQNDFLKANVEPMYNHLISLGVTCEKKIYGTVEQTEIAHVFEVNIKLPEATKCNDDECNFFKKFV